MPKFSIIVPVYKVEKYIRECLESLINQNFKDFEVILVDDASPDGSGAICDEYALKDGRIKVIHKPENEGLGNARKSGVEAASGKWLCYVDSDDWLEENALEYCSENINESDIFVFGFTMCHQGPDGKTVWTDNVLPQRNTAETKKEIGNIVVDLERQRAFPYMCNKLYRTEFVRGSGVHFNIIKSMEDFFYNIEIFEKAERVSVVDKALYNYRKPRGETLASAYNPDFFELSKKRYEAEKRFLKNMDAESSENTQVLCRSYFNHLISCLMRDSAENSGLKFSERLKRAETYFNDVLTVEVLEEYIPDSTVRRIFASLMCRKKYGTAVIIGKLAYIARQNHGFLRLLKR